MQTAREPRSQRTVAATIAVGIGIATVVVEVVAVFGFLIGSMIGQSSFTDAELAQDADSFHWSQVTGFLSDAWPYALVGLIAAVVTIVVRRRKESLPLHWFWAVAYGCVLVMVLQVIY